MGTDVTADKNIIITASEIISYYNDTLWMGFEM